MITDCRHHRQCTHVLPPPFPSLTQMHLTAHFGLLSLRPGTPKHRYPRTPAPRAVARITSSPTFATTDRALTSFLRLPPEIRMEIYRLLLCYNGVIAYGLCPIHLRLIFRKHRDASEKSACTRHGLFPAILECCRTTHGEGTKVLYGENWFQFEHHSDREYFRVWRSWNPSHQSLNAVTKLLVDDAAFTKCAPPGKKKAEQLVELLTLLPGVRDLRFYLTGPSTREWETFLIDVEEAGCLQPLRSFRLEIDVGSNAIGKRRWNRDSGPTVEEVCRWAFEPALLRRESIWRGRRSMRWGFELSPDDIARAYFGVLGTLWVALE